MGIRKDVKAAKLVKRLLRSQPWACRSSFRRFHSQPLSAIEMYPHSQILPNPHPISS
jgi:hypothetical protein